MKMNYLYIILLVFASIFSCDSEYNIDLYEKGSTWLCQLQDGDINAIEKSGFSLVVMDYSPDGSDENKYSPEDIQILINSAITPLAYISIGEAENYRFYWDHNWVDGINSNNFTEKAPSWLGHSNPEWEGNYKVRYWDNDWRDNILKPYLDSIIAQGFNGLYLDIIDGFDYWFDPSNYGGAYGEQNLEGDPIGNREDACIRMIDLVVWIAEYCRSQSSFVEEFMIYPQNGESILDFDHDDSYINAITGIGAEDVWYSETSLKSSNEHNWRLEYLRRFKANDKQVLAIDYVDDGSGFVNANRERISDFVIKCNIEKFRYYAAPQDRELNRISIIDGVQP